MLLIKKLSELSVLRVSAVSFQFHRSLRTILTIAVQRVCHSGEGRNPGRFPPRPQRLCGEIEIFSQKVFQFESIHVHRTAFDADIIAVAQAIELLHHCARRVESN